LIYKQNFEYKKLKISISLVVFIFFNR